MTKLQISNTSNYHGLAHKSITEAIGYLQQLALGTSPDAELEFDYEGTDFSVSWTTEESDEAYALRTKTDAQKAIERAAAQLVKDKAEYKRLQGLFGEEVK